MEHASRQFQPDKITAYFRLEWVNLLLITLSGLLYNLGLLAGPWFEGKLAQCLADILDGNKTAAAMVYLVLSYITVTLLVQGARFIKRFYVRRFANNTSRRMKGVLFSNLVRQKKAALECEGAGELLTKAISDVDDCAEGMRKFTTEFFDTGVAMVGYAGMLLAYDWRLALLCLIFPPVSYICAELMKGNVQRTGAACKKAAAALSTATLDRAENAVTYRIYGCEAAQETGYEQALRKYERSAVLANLWQSALPPLYLVISNISVLFIFRLGRENILAGKWDIAALVAFLSCYGKLAVKSSKAGKLFNAVQKAQVSWKRIRPLMRKQNPLPPPEIPAGRTLVTSDLSFSYGDGVPIFSGLSLTAQPGQIIGITGSVACGKSTLGRTFLCEAPYTGSIRWGNQELRTLSPRDISATVGYLGHDPELWNDTVESNVLCGDDGRAMDYLKRTCLDGEVNDMEAGMQTVVGSGAVRLSGGQAQRLALARTLAHPRPLLVLDDPFSALDRDTEDAIFEALKQSSPGSIIFLISHRLYHFPELDKVVFLGGGKVTVGTHQELLASCPGYRTLYESQTGGKRHEA